MKHNQKKLYFGALFKIINIYNKNMNIYLVFLKHFPKAGNRKLRAQQEKSLKYHFHFAWQYGVLSVTSGLFLLAGVAEWRMRQPCRMLRPRMRTLSLPVGRDVGTPCTTSCRVPPTPKDEPFPSACRCRSCTSTPEGEVTTAFHADARKTHTYSPKHTSS